jgi:hypothetical protein
MICVRCEGTGRKPVNIYVNGDYHSTRWVDCDCETEIPIIPEPQPEVPLNLWRYER